jgi:hypothetical protein
VREEAIVASGKSSKGRVNYQKYNTDRALLDALLDGKVERT